MKNIKNNNYSFTAWVFVVISCIFIVSIGYKSKANSDLAKIHKKNTLNNKITENKKINITKVEQKKEINNNKEDKLNTNGNVNTVSESNSESNNVFVNKIIISKNIDNDENSNTYRNPIDAFKTITTLDDSVIKEIDYEPLFFIWTSINTEDYSLINNKKEFEPINLSMTVKCKNKLIKKLDYTITANTPRWREWVKIDLTNIEEEFLNELWQVEIIDDDDNILETRNFKLIKEQKILVKK